MCIIFFLTNVLDDDSNPYKLILASNRDEFYIRPALQADVWTEDDEHVVGGRDMEEGREGGTWLAVSAKDTTIKVGTLLNLPGEIRIPQSKGRGPIVSDFVTGTMDCHEYAQTLLNPEIPFNGFNFVSIQFNEKDHSCKILHVSNAPKDVVDFPNNTVQGFSNSPWEKPLKKVDNGKVMFEDIVKTHAKDKDSLVRELMELLKNRDKFCDDEELKTRTAHWGKNWEQLGSIFVELPTSGYGTRTRSVILIDKENNLHFIEDSMTGSNVHNHWKRNCVEKKLFC